MSLTVKEIIELLESEKAAQRQQGLKELHTQLATDRVLLRLDEPGDGKAWLRTFQGVFTAIRNEKVACLKKSGWIEDATATSLNRLTFAAETLRWVVERTASHRLLNSKVLKPLYVHCLQMIVHRHALLSPVAFELLQIFNVILTYKEHREHLEVEVWLKICFLAWSVLLGEDEIGTAFTVDEDDEEEVEQIAVAIGDEDVDSGLDVEAPSSEGGDDIDAGTSSRKRARTAKHTARSQPKPRKRTPVLANIPTTRTPPPLSREQITSAHIIHLLFLSPCAVLQHPDYPNLTRAMLNKFTRFLSQYPVGQVSTAHQDVINALLNVLGEGGAEYNSLRDVVRFGRRNWLTLIGLWEGERRGAGGGALREQLLVLFTVLLPFVTHERLLPGSGTAVVGRKELEKLMSLLGSEIGRGAGLKFESLRLCIRDQEMGPFEYDTFRAGSTFGRGSDVMYWAALELYADCLQKICTSQPPQSNSSSRDKKRQRLEHPVLALLHPAHSSMPRTSALQILLFFISRHQTYLRLSGPIHQKLVADLLHLATNSSREKDEERMQGWCFLCLASLIAADGDGTELVGKTERDQAFTLALRRASASNGLTSRGACHLAALLLQSPHLSSTWMKQIETFLSDLNIQGPPFPFDSVCAFLSGCLDIVGTDVRLFRMRLEERVLGWFVERWTSGSSATQGRGRDQQPAYVIGDLIGLLASTAFINLPYSAFIGEPEVQPTGFLSNVLKERAKAKVIRDYMLHASLPSFRPCAVTVDKRAGSRVSDDDAKRQRLAASMVQKLIESSCASLDSSAPSSGSNEQTDLGKLEKDVISSLPAAQIRQAVDLVVLGLILEALLVTSLPQPSQSEGSLTLSACQLASLLLPPIISSSHRWSATEESMILNGLYPLAGHLGRRGSDWTAMIQPSEETGIKYDVLKSLIASEAVVPTNQTQKLLDIVWQSSTFQRTFKPFLLSCTSLLKGYASREQSRVTSNGAGPLDTDDFGHIRTAEDKPSGSKPGITLSGGSGGNENDGIIEGAGAVKCIVALRFLVCAERSQFRFHEKKGEPRAANILISSTKQGFLALAHLFINEIALGQLRITHDELISMLEKFVAQQRVYATSRSETHLLYMVDFLDSTVASWATVKTNEEVAKKVMSFTKWLAGFFSKTQSWRVRHAISQYLSRYLHVDKSERLWSGVNDGDDTPPPSKFLQQVSSDDDARVRFGAATTEAKLFGISTLAGEQAMKLYQDIHNELPAQLSQTEKLLTRTLLLGNIMVASSSVRRGPFWHLVEICLHTDTVTEHVHTVLKAAASRMGLSELSDLLAAYRYQIAYSIDKAGRDLFELPPHLLGHSNVQSCGEYMFTTLVPVLLLGTGDSVERQAMKEESYFSLCQQLTRSKTQGVLECFPDLVARQILYILSGYTGETDKNTSITDIARLSMTYVIKYANAAGYTDPPLSLLRSHYDRILASMLRTVSDTAIEKGGSFSDALSEHTHSEDSLQTFQVLNHYRDSSDFQMHHPNMPAFPANTVMKGIEALRLLLEDVTASTIYHIIHAIFLEVDATPLVNEQARLLNALSFYVAANCKQFSDRILLRNLLRGALVFLRQPDLTHQVQSIIGWGLAIFAKLGESDPFVKMVFACVCEVAREFGEQKSDKRRLSLSRQLLGWIENEATSFLRIPMFAPHIREILYSWPRVLQGELASEIELGDIGADIAAILRQDDNSVSKFCLARQVQTLAKRSGYWDQWAKQDFWIMKAFIPPSSELGFEDARAFAETLFRTKGIIQTPTRIHEQATVGSRHQRFILNPRRLNKQDSPKSAIVAGLFAMLSRQAYTQVYSAYYTIRTLPASQAGEYELKDMTKEARDEVRMISESRIKHPAVRHRKLNEITSFEREGDTPLLHSAWVRSVASLLAASISTKDSFYSPLISVLEVDPAFAEESIPVLVHRCLVGSVSSNGSPRAILSSYFSDVLRRGTDAVATIQTVVNLIQHLRSIPQTSSSLLGCNYWLDIDYILLSQAAIRCGEYTTALLFIELAAENSDANDLRNNAEIELMLYEIYGHIQESDGFYGIHGADIKSSLVRRYEHERKWDKASQLLGAQFEVDVLRGDALNGIVKALHFRGFHKQASITASSINIADGVAGASHAFDFSLGWRTESWDLPQTLDSRSSDANLYAAIRAISCERDRVQAEKICRDALVRQLAHLREVQNEDMRGIQSCVRSILCLRETDVWLKEVLPSAIDVREHDSGKWGEFTAPIDNIEFDMLEGILCTRIALLHSVHRHQKQESLGTIRTPFALALKDAEAQCLLTLSESARRSGDCQIALNFIVRAQALQAPPPLSVSEQFASVLWTQHEQKLAVDLLQELVLSEEQSARREFRPEEMALLLTRLGEWTSEARLQKPTDIRQKYFDAAIGLFQESHKAKGNHAAAQVYERYALFAHRQYQSAMLSPELNRLNIYMERKKHELEQIAENLISSRHNSQVVQELSRQKESATKLLKEDESQAESHHAARDEFLKQALEMYSQSLYAADVNDTQLAIRFCSLWYSNFEVEGYEGVIRRAVERIPSHKFIFLAHQLTARLSRSSGEEFGSQKTLRKLITRICEEHPFHVLYQVFALRQGGEYGGSSQSTKRRQSSLASISSSQGTRQRAALEICSTLRDRGRSPQRVRDLELLCEASLQWAQHPIKAYHDSLSSEEQKANPSHPIPQNIKLRSIKNLQVPVLTASLPIDLTLRYNKIVTVSYFKETYTVAGGLNLPKITECIGTDGQRYKQLYKGEGSDDLRQDAVMEQVFQLVNILLSRDRETKERRLSIRPYKVLPLAAKAGVLEFVENTIPMSNWLAGAHSKYRPHDMKRNEAISILKNVREKMKKERVTRPDVLIKEFVKIKERLKPVMRHFFTERHKQALPWFSNRLNYSRSVAVTSIVGHVLGLGDRHTGNILLDQVTGEVVHIDLGIAFEQGKLLGIPENVPFRLTRDMVDGFGLSGTEGVFRRCCEQTLRVLRGDSEIILTVLEVFKYDPLHSWTANPIKMFRAQEGTLVRLPTPSEAGTAVGVLGFGFGGGGAGLGLESDVADESADRALNSVARKLDGKLSIEYTVNELIVAAMDTVNLATIYYGWSAYF